MSSKYQPLVDNLRKTYERKTTIPLAWRKTQLEVLMKMMKEREDEFHTALQIDLGKGFFESWLTETSLINGNIQYFYDNLEKWMKPQEVPCTPMLLPAKSYVIREPLGVILVIAPWNYPFQLAIVPLAAALAAGNTVVIKPSEIATATSKALAKIIPEYFDKSVVNIVEGGVAETTELLKCKFDHIFFTGSPRVGQIIYEAAAKHLTPVTLELGGKSPVVVDETADLDVTAKRLAWTKFMNCGQTCVAPDYVLCPASVQDKLASKLEKAIEGLYGKNPRDSPDFARVINEGMGNRLFRMVKDDTEKGKAETVTGGKWESQTRYFAPTVLKNVTTDSAVMQEEIFGPVLPILPILDNIEDAVNFISERPKPLSAIIFSKDKKNQEILRSKTSSGSFLINDAVVHVSNHHLPFGGVGNSGIGRFHGPYSFDIFCNLKSVHDNPTFLDPSLRYPPYTKTEQTIIKYASKLKAPHIPQSLVPLVIGVVVGAVIVGSVTHPGGLAGFASQLVSKFI
eukprot:TRINITY_DN7020_c0_g3_i1.p1 TRINITY_DN7020_c0_g3~~TRINITY_DN7020_c0_g3_i1.p1  ORF type:complete len:511 (-),score=88.22 TRINITY_DN7020_c0_g3_i1:66-1598(-)